MENNGASIEAIRNWLNREEKLFFYSMKQNPIKFKPPRMKSLWSSEIS